jgi:diguanylate cyclase (GGDEF)-like protein
MEYLMLLSFTAMAVQLSLLLVLNRLSRLAMRLRLWLPAAIVLVVLPLSVALYQFFHFQTQQVLPPELVPIVFTLIACFCMLCVMPIMVVMARAKDDYARELEEANQQLQAEIAQREVAHEGLKTLSITDELTGLLNRRGFLAMGEQQLRTARRVDKKALLLYADLDNMKEINDTCGHAEGDIALRRTAAVLREVFREADVIGRIGGDEFVVLAMETNGISSDTLLTRLNKRFADNNRSGHGSYALSVSVGTAYFDPGNACTMEQLLDKADRLMYLQKQTKRTRANVRGFKPRSVRPLQRELQTHVG